ncbi:MAG: hypothetical protein WC436_05130 [Candidatus Babeliales bacterium]
MNIKKNFLIIGFLTTIIFAINNSIFAMQDNINIEKLEEAQQFHYEKIQNASYYIIDKHKIVNFFTFDGDCIKRMACGPIRNFDGWLDRMAPKPQPVSYQIQIKYEVENSSAPRRIVYFMVFYDKHENEIKKFLYNIERDRIQDHFIKLVKKEDRIIGINCEKEYFLKNLSADFPLDISNIQSITTLPKPAPQKITCCTIL